MLHILTLTWNGLDKLERLKDGLYRNLRKTGLAYQWYIRDNGSADGTSEAVQEWPNAQLLAVNHNRDNFAQGINSLVNLSKVNCFGEGRDDTFLLLNNDVEFPNDTCIKQMMSMMSDPAVGVVGCRLLYKGTNKLQHAGVIFGERYNRMPYHFKHQQSSDEHAEKNRYFQAVTAAVCLVRPTELDAINGLDEQFHWAFEDVDMCLKIHARGSKIVYCGEAVANHEESASLKKNPLNKLFVNHNAKRFREIWTGRYEIDHEKYLADFHYNEIKS